MPISTELTRETGHLQQLARARQLAASGEARTIRKDSKMSLAEIARACGVDTSTVGRWENGIRSPRGKAGARYASVLDMLARTA